ncbi:MAG: autotransporter-associated beta strand repeat-containing protein [Limisphaerales bacterium]
MSCFTSRSGKFLVAGSLAVVALGAQWLFFSASSDSLPVTSSASPTVAGLPAVHASSPPSDSANEAASVASAHLVTSPDIPQTRPVVAAGGGILRQDLLWRQPVHEPAFAAFREWTDRYAAADASARKALILEGEHLARQRRAEFARLMHDDPARALALAVPETVRRTLPPTVLAQLETPVDARGDIEHFAALPAPGESVPPNTYEVQLGEERLRAFVTAERADQPSRYQVPVHGYRLDQNFVVRPTAGRLLEPVEVAEARAAADGPAICPTSKQDTQQNGEEAAIIAGSQIRFFCATGHAASQLAEDSEAEQNARPGAGILTAYGGDESGGDILLESPYTEGDKTLIIMRVDFPNHPSTTHAPITFADANTSIGKLSNAWKTWSYGRCTLNVTNSDVTAVILRMPQASTWYADNGGPNTLHNHARTAAATAGYNPDIYNFQMVAMSGQTPGFGWAGLASVGGKRSWVKASAEGYFTDVAIHELGHNLGLPHAQGYYPVGGDPIAPGGTIGEYGDAHDTMGGASIGRPYNTRFKRYLDWVLDAELPTITANGVYRIGAHDNPAVTGVRGLRVPRTSTQHYIIEHRSSQGTANANGVLVRWGPSGSGNGRTQLLDMTPNSSSGMTDAPLPLGNTFVDAPSGIFITPLAKITGGAFNSVDVLVNVNKTLPPPPWVNEDIGGVGAAGFATFADGTHLIYGAGADIWGTADEFQFVRQTLTGNCDLRARVTLQANTHGFAKAGVMLRNGTAAGATYAAMFITPSNGFRFQYRTAANGTSISVAGPALNAASNNWVRLTRTGNVFTSFVSSNGLAWTPVGSVTNSMAAALSGGLAVCSHVDAALSAAQFDNVSVTDTTALAILANDTFDVGMPTPGNDADDPLDLEWAGNAATLTVAADATLGTGNALNVDATGTLAGIFGAFAPRALVNAGDSLKLSFDFRHTQAVGNGANGFRFGLFNAAGDGYFVMHGTGGAGNFTLNEDAGADGTFGTGTTSGLASTTKDSLNDQLKHTATFTVTKTAAGLGISSVVDGVSLTATDNTPVITAFDMIGIRNGAITVDFRVDNVRVEFAGNLPPVFTVNPLTKAPAFVGSPYAATLAGDATDPNVGDTITFSKVSGPAWLAVAANGDLSGTPAAGNAGTNSFVVRATDASGLTADATLNLFVAAAAVANFWDGTGTSWNNVASWSTVSGAATPDPAAVPGGGNTAIFNITGVNTPQTVNLDADQTAAGLTFASSGPVMLQGGGTNRALTLGAAGIALNAGAGGAIIGSATNGQNVNLTLGLTQFWTNPSSNLLSVLNGVDLGSGALTVAGGGNTEISGAITGSGTLAKTGAGTLTLGGTNTFTGATTVSGGTVIVKTSAALGANAGGTTVASGATLDLQGTAFNNLNLGAEVITVAGVGVGGNGVLVNNGAFRQDNAVQRVILAEDATFGGTSRWDLRAASGWLDMGGFTLTKIGPNQISLVGVTVTNPGNVFVAAGTFSVESAAKLGGSAANNITLAPGARLQLYQNSVTQTWSVTMNNAIFRNQSGTMTWGGPVSLSGTNTFDVASGGTLTLTGEITGSGSLVKTTTGTLVLSATNHYSGDTTVNAGTLVLATPSLAANSAVRLASGTTLALTHAATNVIGRLYLNGVLQEAGLWGAIGSGATHETNLITGSGLLEVTEGITPYDIWAASYSLTGTNADKTADADGDGVPNFVEFALNGNPTSASSTGLVFAKIQPDNGGPAFTYTMAVRAGATFAQEENRMTATVDGLSYTIEAAFEMDTWDASEAVSEILPALTSGLPVPAVGWEYHTFRTGGSPATTPRAFLRAHLEAQ